MINLFSKQLLEIPASIPDWIWTVLYIFLIIEFCSIVFRIFFRCFDVSLPDLHLKRRFTNLLCKSNLGFAIAYKLGWAERGVHFFDCGQDCHICPKKVTCDHFPF